MAKKKTDALSESKVLDWAQVSEGDMILVLNHKEQYYAKAFRFKRPHVAYDVKNAILKTQKELIGEDYADTEE